MRQFLKRVVAPTGLIAAGVAVGAALARMPVRDPQAISGMRMRSPARPPGGAFLNQFFFNSLSWYACALSLPLFVWLARRFPFNRRQWVQAALVHLASVSAMVLLTATAYYAWNTSSPDFAAPLLVFIRSRLASDALPFLAMIAAIHAFEYRRRERLRDEEATRLSAQLAKSRLEALTAQLQPHFLFNTLQGISTLMHRDVAAADAMLSQLSDLLRRALRRGDQRHEIPLTEELEMLDAYVAICTQRFGDRLTFRKEVDPTVSDALVPFFILQPLVENSLEHGVARRGGKGTVTVVAAARANELVLSVIDDGPGLPPGTGKTPIDGIGLSNSRARLRELYGSDQQLSIGASERGGVEVSVVIPLRRGTVQQPAADSPAS